jgi:SHS2 domain-containing protein
MGFRFIEHTADVCAECRAADFAGLLEVSAAALYEVALDRVRSDSDIEKEVRAEGGTREETLIRWLQELLFLLDVERFAATVFRFDEAAPSQVRATLRGYTCKPEERATEVKAATYHDMQIENRDGELAAAIVFDL